MVSLFYVLANQHGEEFAPFRCNAQTLERLLRYFEDVVTENKLHALVIERRHLDKEGKQEIERLKKLCHSARQVYLFAGAVSADKPALPDSLPRLSLFDDSNNQYTDGEPFIVVLEPRFCGLLVAHPLPEDATHHVKTYEMMWTFDPNVVFTALHHLMEQILLAKPDERLHLEQVLNASTPNAVSLKMAFSLTTKLAILMQRQNELEMATNRISYVISNTLEIENVLQTAIEEIGGALKAKRAALVLWQEDTQKFEGTSIYERQDGQGKKEKPLATYTSYTFYQPERKYKTGALPPGALNAVQDSVDNPVKPGCLEVPITYHNKNMGKLIVEDDTLGRIWESEEILMVKTISDQLAVAISHARLFRQMERQAITDPLTGLFNHRYFQMSLEREIRFADRSGDPLSLILLDLDDLKKINDAHGHLIGDAALMHISRIMKQTVREIDVCARYGGDEFVIILPRTSREAAVGVAERLREAIAAKPLPKVGEVTVSIGIASYPVSASTRTELIEKADQAMFQAKDTGKNRVRVILSQNQNA